MNRGRFSLTQRNGSQPASSHKCVHARLSTRHGEMREHPSNLHRWSRMSLRFIRATGFTQTHGCLATEYVTADGAPRSVRPLGSGGPFLATLEWLALGPRFRGDERIVRFRPTARPSP